MERVRGVLLRQRAGLVDRWDRQLKAAAAAGFALDPTTAQVLPQLLDATDRSLERKFRAVEISAGPAEAEAKRAALQGALLSDFLYDVALEHLPDMSDAEQRRLSEALSQAAVEVLVKTALLREQEKRKRDQARLARLTHDLRNSLTAARLAVDLLRRKGALPESKASRGLERSLARLREGIEDNLLDEALAAGGLRTSRVRLTSVLADAHSAARELGALDKNVKIVLERPATVLQIQADPRVLRPAVRGLLRAALQLAKPGSTIFVSAVLARNRARFGVQVQECITGKRLPRSPVLSFARRAAREHGGSLIARKVPGEGFFFGLDLPRVGPT
jgi:signal transduction histidine kinase